MHTAQLASAQILQHRGHFGFMNYFVVSGTRGRMCLISDKEGLGESDSTLFFVKTYRKEKKGTLLL